MDRERRGFLAAAGVLGPGLALPATHSPPMAEVIDAGSLYTTGGPCPMCMGALVWAGVREVVWATSIAGIRAAGFGQIGITAAEVAGRASAFCRPLVPVGGVLANEAGKLFAAAPSG